MLLYLCRKNIYIIEKTIEYKNDVIPAKTKNWALDTILFDSFVIKISPNFSFLHSSCTGIKAAFLRLKKLIS